MMLCAVPSEDREMDIMSFESETAIILSVEEWLKKDKNIIEEVIINTFIAQSVEELKELGAIEDSELPSIELTGEELIGGYFNFLKIIENNFPALYINANEKTTERLENISKIYKNPFIDKVMTIRIEQ